MNALLFLILVTSFYYAQSLRCNCNTNDAGCRAGFCEGAYCYKRETQADGKTSISKGCDPAGANTCTGLSALGYGASACQCNTGDLCNAAPFATRPFFLIIVGSFVVSIFFKIF